MKGISVAKKTIKKKPIKFFIEETEYPDQFDVVARPGIRGKLMRAVRVRSKEDGEKWIRTKSG
jgi:hypothetical protein